VDFLPRGKIEIELILDPIIALAHSRAAFFENPVPDIGGIEQIHRNPS